MKNRLPFVALLLFSCTSRADLLMQEQHQLQHSIDKYEELSWMNNHDAQHILREYEDTILREHKEQEIDSLNKVVDSLDSISSIYRLRYDSLQKELIKIKRK